MMIQVLSHRFLLSIIGFLIFLYGFSQWVSIARVKRLTPEGIILAIGNSELTLNKQDIACATKVIRYHLIENYWIKISLKNRLKLLCRNYWILNEPANDFQKKLSEMGIPLRNFP
jgi:hypothetical protein